MIIFANSFGPRSGPTDKKKSWSGPKPFNTLIVIIKDFFVKVNFEQKSADKTQLSPSPLSLFKKLSCACRWDFYPPLIVAVLSDNIEMVRLLLLSGASVNSHDSLG